MTNPEQELFTERDIVDCRQLPALLFANTETGSETDVTYVPLIPSDVNMFSRHFLRFTSDHRDGVNSGRIEVIETDLDGRFETPKMWCELNDRGDFKFGNTQEVIGDPLPVVWPVILGSPQIEKCLYNFQYAGYERTVDQDELLEELSVTRTTLRAVPHIRTRELEEAAVKDFRIDFVHKQYAMPRELVGITSVNSQYGQILDIGISYTGNPVLDAKLAFDGNGKLIPNTQRKEELVKQVGAVASFKRAVFDR